MHDLDVENLVAYACWAPSYEVNDIISITDYEIKIKKDLSQLIVNKFIQRMILLNDN